MLRHALVFMSTITATLVTGGHGPHARIEWHQSTQRLVARHACYARMIRLSTGTLLCCYQKGRRVWIKRSTDDGRKWRNEQAVATYAHGIAANPELLQLHNGDLLLCYNERPTDGVSPYAIMVRTSHDNGQTWDGARRIFKAGTRFGDGCWEPAPLQFPDGDIHIYFANEAPYRNSNEQEITMIPSGDGGRTWGKPSTVSFRPGHRDGMPVPCLLTDGKTVVMAIEDSGANGNFKPVILSSDIGRRWGGAIIGGDSPQRSRAISPPLPPAVYAGAPYICQLPSGITVLSVQSDEDCREPQMAVYVGDTHARTFRNKSIPFPLETNVSGKWNALFAKNTNTVTAISSTRMAGTSGVWIVDGILKP